MASMTSPQASVRETLLRAGLWFAQSATGLPGVMRIAVIGSITTARPSPKDIDFLVTISDEADLKPLAALARRLTGRLQSYNLGADVFLASESGRYLGRTCPWALCRPGIRASCDALHCGRRPHLHDDLQTVTLADGLIAAPPLGLWPAVVRRCEVPKDVEDLVAAFDEPHNKRMQRPRGAPLMRGVMWTPTLAFGEMKMRLKTWGGLAVLALAVAGGCSCRESPRPLGPDDYAVYAAVLTHFAAHDRPVASAKFVVLEVTRSHHPCMSGISVDQTALWARALGHAAALEATARDFRVQAGRDARLESPLPVAGACVLAKSAKVDSVLRSQANGWAAFDSLYSDPRPSGLFTLSRVGFTEDHTNAIVYCLNEFGNVGALGRFYFLSKEGGAWRVLFNPGSTYIS